MLFACGGPAAETPDAAVPDVDAGGGGNDGGNDAGRDAGMSACAAPRAVTLTTGMQTISGDTTSLGMGLARADGCGGMGTASGSPEEVIALTLPGASTDMVGVLLTTAVTGTDATFDTVLEIRPACMSATNAVCIDDTSADDYRSTGTFLAPGGSTVFMIVRGYTPALTGYLDSGPWTMDVSTFLNPAPPTFTSGTATYYDAANLVMSITGGDPAGAGDSLRFSFLDAAGTPIGLDLDASAATPDEIELIYNFNPSVLGMTTFTSDFDLVRINAMFGFADFPQLATATELRVAVLNAFGLESAEATIPLATGTTVGVDAACDATHRCADTLTCTADVCVATPEVIAACATATALTIATPTTTTTSTMTTATLDTTEGLFEGSCVGTGGLGAETFFTVTVPAGGTYDIIADTNGPMIADTDTMLYDRTICVDPSTETGCNDDDDRLARTDPPLLASYLVVLDAAAGDHTIVVDSWQTLDVEATVDLTVSLRPVLATGADCDAMGVMNRCAAGTCPAAAPFLCP